MIHQPINLVNGNIITLDENCPHANSLSIVNGKITSINSPIINAKTINLHGATITPGFVDSHLHLTNMGKQLEYLQLRDINSSSEIVDMIQKRTQELPKGQWIIGYGWDQTKWEDTEFPQSEVLNLISPHHPVYLIRIDGHSAWVNQKAFEVAGLSVPLDNPLGGDCINNCILIDNSMNLVLEHLPQDTTENIKRWIALATDTLIKRGVTSVHDAWQTQNIIESIHSLIEEDKFPIRCYGMLGNTEEDLLHHYFQNGHFKSDKYQIRAVKAFIDGALGSRGAALIAPYADDEENNGLILTSSQEFKLLANNCAKYGFQLCAHAIGDRAVSFALNAYEHSIKGLTNHRWRIEHSQMISDTDINRFNSHKIIPSMQPSHCISDMRWMKNRLGSKRIHQISRFKTLIQSGCKIPGGSDAPIENGNPLEEMYFAISRKDINGNPPGGWQSQESVTPIQALKMFTKWSAYASFHENKRGQIKDGYDADLTVLSKDILSVNPSEIPKIQILMTIVGGKIVYKR
jgi:predicted amidohydrolase YtcJ